MEERLVLEDITKTFGSVVAVKDLSLKVEKRSFVALLGPSGCGKTTTLHIIAGLIRPSTGRVYMDGEDVTELPPQKRNIGLVFQDYAVFPHMNVYDNISFGLVVRRLPKEEVRRRVKEVSELLDIENILGSSISGLNQSELQRVSLARTIVTEPSVILLDEPLSNLDAYLRIKMRAEFKRLQRELGLNFLYVTHDQIEAISMCDKVAVMNNGYLQQYDSPDRIYNHPSNLFVASFIGSPPMNLLDCSCKYSEGRLVLEGGDWSLDITPLAESVPRLAETSELVLGIRPENILIDAGEGGIKTRVETIENIGTKKIINFYLGGRLVKATAPKSIDLSPGKHITVKFPLEKIHIFKRHSGVLIV